MADPISPGKNALQLGSGWTNDLVANVADVCHNIFSGNEKIVEFTPKSTVNYPPDSGPVYDLPALHVWVQRSTYDTPAAGQLHTDTQFNTHQHAYVNIQYIHHDQISLQTREQLNMIMDTLTEGLRRHHNLNGLVNGCTIYETTIATRHYVKNGLILCQTGIIHAIYRRTTLDVTSTKP